MTLALITIPCLDDNYAYVLHNTATGEAALIDAPEEAAIATELDARGLKLSHILITHHHNDHIDGVPGLRARDGAKVIGAAADAHRLPALDQTVKGGDRLTICGEPCDVIEVYGHTIGHVAYHFPDSALVFTADSLMALGCGRLFEGTAAQMWDSLSRLRALPDETTVCSGHEYTAGNARFALTVDPDNAALQARAAAVNAARAEGRPTVPSSLAEEKATNPFLRADDPTLKAALGMPDASDVEVFAEVRGRKDRF